MRRQRDAADALAFQVAEELEKQVDAADALGNAALGRENAKRLVEWMNRRGILPLDVDGEAPPFEFSPTADPPPGGVDWLHADDAGMLPCHHACRTQSLEVLNAIAAVAPASFEELTYPGKTPALYSPLNCLCDVGKPKDSPSSGLVRKYHCCLELVIKATSCGTIQHTTGSGTTATVAKTMGAICKQVIIMK